MVAGVGGVVWPKLGVNVGGLRGSSGVIPRSEK
jgi:hypothetical protein